MWHKNGWSGYCGPDPREAVKEAFNVVREVFGDQGVEHTIPVDVFESADGAFVVRASLPGFRREDVRVNLVGGALYIKASRSETPEGEEQPKYFIRERAQGNFSRRVRLPDAADEGIKAELKDGVLTVHVPKAAPDEGRSVPIE